MAYKRPVRTSVYVKAYPLTRQRIKIPQPVTRPVQISTKDLMKTDLIQPEPWWHTIHRRGLRRVKVGEDPLEARAVSKSQVYGTLPERIVYKYLTHNLKLVSGADFDFQSSQAGGRIELGGLVADFLFENMRMVIQVQGPTHQTYLRGKKDEEQRMILADMGYRVFDVEEPTIYDESRLEDWMRRVFGLSLTVASGEIYIKSPGTNISTSALLDTESGLASFEEEYEDEVQLEGLSNEIKALAMSLKQEK